MDQLPDILLHYRGPTKNNRFNKNPRKSNIRKITWNRCLNVLCLTSNIQTSPFFPAEINNWCCGAYTILDAPWSWHAKAKRFKLNLIKNSFVFRVKRAGNLHDTMAFFCGSKVSQMATFLLSELWPAVLDKIIRNALGLRTTKTHQLRPNYTTPKTWNPWSICCGIRCSIEKKKLIKISKT